MPRWNRNRTVGRRWREGDWVAVGGPGGLLLHSAAADHCPVVRLKLRDDAQNTDFDIRRHQRLGGILKECHHMA